MNFGGFLGEQVKVFLYFFKRPRSRNAHTVNAAFLHFGYYVSLRRFTSKLARGNERINISAPPHLFAADAMRRGQQVTFPTPTPTCFVPIVDCS